MTPVPVEDVADKLHSAAIHLLRRVRDVDAATGLNAARLSALSYLVFAGPATVGELARAEQVTPANISQLINGMQNHSLVERVEDPNDRRVTLVCPTKKGERIMREGRLARVELLTSLLSKLDANELATLSQAAHLIEDTLRA